jgi:hypothetical protein
VREKYRGNNVVEKEARLVEGNVMIDIFSSFLPRLHVCDGTHFLFLLTEKIVYFIPEISFPHKTQNSLSLPSSSSSSTRFANEIKFKR